jgi:hypothetical protein
MPKKKSFASKAIRPTIFKDGKLIASETELKAIFKCPQQCRSLTVDTGPPDPPGATPESLTIKI